MAESNKEIDELYLWDYHLDYISRIEATPEDKERMRAGYIKLMDLFGANWLPSLSGKPHGLLYNFINKAPWSQIWIADFAEKLLNLKQVSGFNYLKKRLMNATQFEAAFPEFLLASKFLRGGYRPVLYPATLKGKSADMRITLSSDIFFEIKTLQTPKERAKAKRTEMELMFNPHFMRSLAEDIHVTGRILKVLSKPRIKEIKSLLLKAIDSVRNGADFQEIKIPKVVEYYVFKGQAPSLVPEKLREGIYEPPARVDEVGRIIDRIEKVMEEKTVSVNDQLVIVIYDDHLNRLFFRNDLDFYLTLTDQLEETVYEYENLVAAIIMHTSQRPRESESDEASTNKNDDLLLVTVPLNFFYQENILVIRNKYSSNYFNDELIEVLKQN